MQVDEVLAGDIELAEHTILEITPHPSLRLFLFVRIPGTVVELRVLAPRAKLPLVIHVFPSVSSGLRFQ